MQQKVVPQHGAWIIEASGGVDKCTPRELAWNQLSMSVHMHLVQQCFLANKIAE